jgi:CHAT domain-containing protein
VRALAALHPDAELLVGRQATATASLAALDGATLAHVACHGRFRSDAPLFSSLELADGPLTALDLQGMRRPPEVLVLSACDLALSDRRPGDELLGVAAAMLAMGTRTVVASVVPVHDAGSRRLMAAFHRELVTAPPATALACAQANAPLAGFVCLGSG